MLLLYLILAFSKTAWTLNGATMEKEVYGSTVKSTSQLPNLAKIEYPLLNCPNCQHPHTHDRILEAARSLKKFLKPRRKAAIWRDEETTLSLAFRLIMDVLERSEREVVHECKNQFFWERWNCDISSIPLLQEKESFKQTRQTAFLQALTSAAVTLMMSRQCAAGYYRMCYCQNDNPRYDKHNSGVWWRGCFDHHDVGEKMSKALLKKIGRGTDDEIFMYRRNNFVGRKVFKDNLTVHCKCIGPTGSCSRKLCWRTSPSVRTLSRKLKTKYYEAQQIQPWMVKKRSQKYSTSRTYLLFIEDEPNFCKRNDELNIKGTLGRQCVNRNNTEGSLRITEDGENSCLRLCTFCGYRVRQEKVTVNSECDCKFNWCCKVNCTLCPVTKYWYHCVP